MNLLAEMIRLFARHGGTICGRHRGTGIKLRFRPALEIANGAPSVLIYVGSWAPPYAMEIYDWYCWCQTCVLPE